MSAMCSMEKLKQILQKHQCKLTSQRQTILQVFLDHSTEHLSAEDVYQLLREQGCDIGLATVYRSLELLAELEVLQKIDFGDGKTRYEINKSADRHYHHHLICLKCGRVIEFADDLLENLEQSIYTKSRFQIVDHQVKFYGYCQECQVNSEN